MRKPSVVNQPEATDQLKRGFDQMARLLAGTLGPSQGMVLSTKEMSEAPEILNDAATIARRVIEIPDRRQDVGAMILRQMVWRVHQRVGDGGATAAVLGQAILDYGYRMVVAGASAVAVQDGIKLATEAAVAALDEMAEPAESWDDLAAVGLAVTGNQLLGDILGELVELLGPRGHIRVEDFMAPTIERIYQSGGRWSGDLISPYLITANASQQAIATNAHVAIVAGKISDSAEIIPLLKLVAESEHKTLLLVAFEISPEVRNTLVGTHSSDDSEINIVGFTLNRAGVSGATELEDLGLLTGAAVLATAKGDSLTRISAEQLGRAGRVEAGKQELFVMQGAGSRSAIQDEMQQMQSRLDRMPPDDDDRKTLALRVARMGGNSATLKIGSISKTERAYLHAAAEQGIKAVQSAARSGVVPGGGTAYLRCQEALAPLLAATRGDERAGVMAVWTALQAPFEKILGNGGVQVPAVQRDVILNAEPGLIYDVMGRGFAQARGCGVMDSAEVLTTALTTAASGAAMALSVDTLVLHKKPKMSYDP